ncbi:MAG: HNH endonuclease [Ginsengibacter sp.]
MPFSEKIKLTVKRKAHQSCCICKSIGIEIHHIVPQCEGGKDTLSNAAPLCPTCHETYGANPMKRKFVIECRDIWYEICAKRYKITDGLLLQLETKIDRIYSKLNSTVLTSNVAKAIPENIIDVFPNSSKTNHKLIKDSLGEVVNYFLSLKDPVDDIAKEDFNVSYSLAWETIGAGNFDIEFNERRQIFKEKFGSILSRKLVLYVLKTGTMLDWHSGVDDNKVVSFLNQFFIAMVILMNHEDLSDADSPLEVRILSDGNLFVRLKDE